MAVPKKKISRSKKNSRRSHDKIKKIFVTFDSVTNEPKLSHHISLKDGFYNGRHLIKFKKQNKYKEINKSKKN